MEVQYLIDTMLLIFSYLVGTPLLGKLIPLVQLGAVVTLLTSAVAIALYVKEPRMTTCVDLHLTFTERSSNCLALNSLMLRTLAKTLVMNIMVLLIVLTGSLAVLLACELTYHFVLSRMKLYAVVVAERICCVGNELYAEACNVRGKVVEVYRRALVAQTPLNKISFVIPDGAEVRSLIEQCGARDNSGVNSGAQSA